MTDLPAAVRQLQELQEKAIPDPWWVNGWSPTSVAADADAADGSGPVVVSVAECQSEADAALIVAAVNLVGPLIEDWLRLRKVEEAARVVAALEDMARPDQRSLFAAWSALRAALALPGGEE